MVKVMLSAAAAVGAMALKAVIAMVKALIVAIEKALKAGLKALLEMLKRRRHERDLAKARKRVLDGKRTRRFRLRGRSWSRNIAVAARWKEQWEREKAEAEARARRARKTTRLDGETGTKAVPIPPAGKAVPVPRRTTTRGADVSEEVITTYFNEAREALRAAFQIATGEFEEMFSGERTDRDWRHIQGSMKEMNTLLAEFAGDTRTFGGLFEDKPTFIGAFGEVIGDLGNHLDQTAETVTDAINVVREAHGELVSHVEERQAGHQAFNTAHD